MAAHTVGEGEIAVGATLTPDTVDTVTFDRDCNRIEVANVTGAAVIYFTLDGSTPTVGGKKCYFLPAAIGALELEPNAPGVTLVKLISAGAGIFRVTQTA